MKVLFIAYYFDPFEGVGAKRISYWANNIKKLNSSIERCDVITAIDQKGTLENINIDNIYYVENTKKSLFGKIIKFDPGASWLNDLRLFLKEHLQRNNYDYVIITGNPFLHFFIINDFRKYNIKTIIDFRDPFATNPRGYKINNMIKKIKSKILRSMEKYFLNNADYIITVNKYCAELLENYEEYKNKIFIIDNGYDERIVNNIEREKLRTSKIKLCYTGKLYEDRNPTVFLEIIKNNKDFNFYHVGVQSEYLLDSNENNIKQYGMKSYENTLSILNSMDIAIIFTSGFYFESTTKIFDYMVLNKTILIITDKELRSGQLHNITMNYPSIYWSKNTKSDILNTLNRIQEIDFTKIFNFDSYSYSREYGLKNLLSLINKENCETFKL